MGDQRQPNPSYFWRSKALRRTLLPILAAAVVLGACGGSGGDEQETASTVDAGRSSGSSTDSEVAVDSANEPAETETETTEPSILGPELSDYEPIVRPDGIELAFLDGALGPARLGDTIGEIRAALGASYEVTAEDSIRVDFPAGYSISRDGEVLFFAIEEEGIITVFMTQHSRVGLDGGFRPGSALADAIDQHGEPNLTLGPEGREFASFEDGTGADGSVSVLVAIGQFGGPVGVYDGVEVNQSATGYQLENANIKELWFWAN